MPGLKGVRWWGGMCQGDTFHTGLCWSMAGYKIASGKEVPLFYASNLAFLVQE